MDAMHIMHSEHTTRVTATLPYDMLMHVNYWAAKKNMSVNQFLAYALGRYLSWEQSDHAVPTKETDRLNTCVDAVTDLGNSVHVLQNAVSSGFDSMMSIICGDSAFLKEDDGDIDPIVETKDSIYKKRRRKNKNRKG